MKKGFLLSSSSSSSSKVVNERNKNKTSSVILPDAPLPKALGDGDDDEDEEDNDDEEENDQGAPCADTLQDLFRTVCNNYEQDGGVQQQYNNDGAGPPTKVQQLSQSKDNGGWIFTKEYTE